MSPLPVSQLSALIIRFPSILPHFSSPPSPFLQGFALMLQLGMGKAPVSGSIQPGEMLEKMGNLPPSLLWLPAMCKDPPKCRGFYNSLIQAWLFLTSLKMTLIP